LFCPYLLFIGLGCYVATAEQAEQMPSDLSNVTKQQQHISINEPVCAPSKNAVINGVYLNPEIHPAFPSGYEKFSEFFGMKLRQMKLEVAGRLVIETVIETNGKITLSKVLRGVPGLEDEQIRHILKQLPRWKPGMHNGKVVRTRYSIPIKLMSLTDG
jgi:hypothetical protein